jgi:hypothetical protein
MQLEQSSGLARLKKVNYMIRQITGHTGLDKNFPSLLSSSFLTRLKEKFFGGYKTT